MPSAVYPIQFHLIEPSLILHQSPRSLVQLVAQALVPSSPNSEDALMAAFINSGTLALLNAGSVPMRGVICAIAVGEKEGKDGYIVDPDESTEPVRTLAAHGCFAFMFTSRTPGKVTGRCVWTNWRSSPGKTFKRTSLDEAKKIALQAAGKVYRAFFEAIGGGDVVVLGDADGEDMVEGDEESGDDGDVDDDKMEI